ncbi:peptidase domain-containing ABC transporter [Bacillus sp. ISL-51]|uniref:peptidase domain-containing ABC transporter n=1 Tax=Bacteria TaxID=2 RepID=UPI001BEB3CE8|nr:MULTISPECIES: peptidase domain-containing ABC transporter [Bacteria]MBT2573730.1 peptidase domain-containing ABC transporter [Bacillus sp. ISL-51]MBT2634939.1 peptidase domain-containing ABC transporter [Bacillus sp. ISL-26]MBT2712414.1 peptidase domain-containing ABC transporter [Pseudomonas sp. ISL-88]
MKISKKKLPVILQRNQFDCGITCLAMVLSRAEGIKINPNKLKLNKEIIGRDGTDLIVMKKISETFDYDFKAFRTDNLNQLKEINKIHPLIVHWNHNHFVVVESFGTDTVKIIDPSTGRLTITLEEFKTFYNGISIMLTRKNEFERKDKIAASLKDVSSFKKIGKYLLKDKKLLGFIIIFTFIFQALNLMTPFLTQYIIDSFISGDEKSLPIPMLLTFVIVSIVLFFSLSLIRMKFIIKLQLKINKSMTDKIISKIFSLPLKFFEANTAGDISTRIHNIAVIREVISRLASTLILDISLIFVFFIVMFVYSPVLSFIVLSGAMIQVLSTKFLLPKIEMFTKQEVNSQSNFQSQLIEILRSMTFIKTIGETKNIESQLNYNFDHQLDYFSKRMNYSSLLGAVSNAINLSLPLLILIVGTWSASSIGLTLGAVIAFSNIAGRFMSPLGSIIGSLESIKLVEEMVDRVEAVLDEKDEEVNDKSSERFNPAVHNISLKNIDFSYNGTDCILNNVNLMIRPREKITLIGKTGSGKSTLIKIIAGLYQKTAGEICYGEFKIEDVNMVKLRETLGYIVQDVNLFNDTIINNIKYFSEKITMEEVVQAAKEACIHEDIIKMPMGYHTIIGENGITLSGGQRQRISIARVLAKNPQILFIDEGTSNLDKDTELNILNNIYNKDITVISITHRTEWLEFSESIYEIENGNLKAIKSKYESRLQQTN